jgi:hypothetical protein
MDRNAADPLPMDFVSVVLAAGAPGAPGDATSSPPAVVLVVVAVIVVLVLSGLFWQRLRGR